MKRQIEFMKNVRYGIINIRPSTKSTTVLLALAVFLLVIQNVKCSTLFEEEASLDDNTNSNREFHYAFYSYYLFPINIKQLTNEMKKYTCFMSIIESESFLLPVTCLSEFHCKFT